MDTIGLGSWPARRARIDGPAVAFRQGARRLTYSALADRVEALAAAFVAAGVQRADRIAYLGPNDIAAFEVFFAAGRIGAVFTPFNWRLAPPEIAYLVDDCRPAILVHAPEFLSTVRDLRVRTVDVSQEYEELIGTDHPPAPDVDVGLADDAVILYTSGTTGRPKGAVLTHGNVTFNTMNQLAHVDVRSSDTALCISPLFHATGLGQVSLPTLFKGGTVVMVPKFDAGEILHLIEDLGIASFSAVPTMLQLMAEHSDFATTDLTSLRYAVYGGSPVREPVAVAWQKRGVTLLQGYGMTEASPGVTMASPAGALDHPVSIGVPHFFTDISVDGTLRAARPGQSGELLVRGPNVFRGYWNRPDDTAAAFTDGWYRSGDIVRIGADGWGYVVDRIKDLIISGGENVYPSEVENELARLPGVSEAAVVAVPDERWGEVGSAFVVTAPGSGWTGASLRAALTERIAAFKIPKYVQVVDGLPRTATGKIRKSRLGGSCPPEETP